MSVVGMRNDGRPRTRGISHLGDRSMGFAEITYAVD